MDRATADGASPIRPETLFEALSVAEPAVVARLEPEARRQLTSYPDADELSAGHDVRLAYRTTLRHSRLPSSVLDVDEASLLSSVGSERARQGVGVDDLLRAWRMGVSALVAEAHHVARRLDLPSDGLYDFVEAALRWEDLATVLIGRAFRRAEWLCANQTPDHRGRFVRDLLLGTAAPGDLAQQAAVHGLDAERRYVAVRVRGGGRADDAAREIGLGDDKRPLAGFTTVVGGDLAGFDEAAPGPVAGLLVGVGPPMPLGRLAESFRLASRALHTASSFGLTGVHDMASLGIRPAIVSDQDVAATLHDRYLAPLDGLGDGRDTIIASVRAYFAAGMHVDRAAEALFVHPNTLRNRLARFAELTAADLHSPAVVCEVWWVLERAVLAGPDPDAA